MRIWSIIFAVGLAILWIAGLSTPSSATWLTWLDGVGALLGFGIGFSADDFSTRMRVAAPVILAGGLFVLWILGISTNGMPWQSWWTFVFACGYLLNGLYGFNRPVVTSSGKSTDEEADKNFRESA